MFRFKLVILLLAAASASAQVGAKRYVVKAPDVPAAGNRTTMEGALEDRRVASVKFDEFRTSGSKTSLREAMERSLAASRSLRVAISATANIDADAPHVDDLPLTGHVSAAFSDDQVATLKQGGFEIEAVAEAVPLDRPVVSAVAATGVRQNVRRVRADQLFERTPNPVTGRSVVVAVLDTGVAPVAGFGDRLLPGRSFLSAASGSNTMDRHGHGTHVAGTVAGSDGVGAAPGAKILPVKILDDRGTGYFDDFLRGVSYAMEQNASVIHCSLQYPNREVGAGQRESFQKLMESLEAKGIVLVSATGNSPRTPLTDPAWPSRGNHVISVGALQPGEPDSRLERASFSVFGAASGVARPSVSASGVNVESYAPQGGFATMNGTSMAAPLVSGLVALRRELFPTETAAQTRAALEGAASRVGTPTPTDPGLGKGLPDALKLVGAESAPAPTPPSAPDPIAERLKAKRTHWEKRYGFSIAD
jgi:subtilisin family serine protease